MAELRELLERLSSAHGPSGHERAVRNLVRGKSSRWSTASRSTQWAT
jgi:putative aminopeptidase FrvX